MKKIGISFIFLASIIVIAGLFAPTEFKVEKEVVISQPKSKVFDYLKLLKNGNNWSPWVKRDPNIVQTYSGQDGTVGFISAWSGNKEVGVGEQEIKNIVPNERLDIELRFKKPMEDTCASYLITESISATQTKVTWGMMGKSPFPRNVICLVLNVKKKLNADFQEGLDQLKVILEK